MLSIYLDKLYTGLLIELKSFERMASIPGSLEHIMSMLIDGRLIIGCNES